MQENVFWDKEVDKKGIKNILRHEKHPKFIDFASLLLSRTNNTKIVFTKYLHKITFCRNWNRIKRQMRTNKWNDERIIYWNTVYKVALKNIDKNKLHKFKEKKIIVSPEIKIIGKIIREARKRKEWTQKDLAENVGLSQQLISFIERGYTNISFLTLKKITDVLNLQISVKNKDRKQPNGETYTSTA